MRASVARRVSLAQAGTVVLFAMAVLSTTYASDPWADRVVRYTRGTQTGSGAFGDPQVALGSPERLTGEGVFPSVVSMFNPPFGEDEIVEIDFGGELVVEFDEPIVDDPANPFGIDLTVFGNGGFIDVDFPNGQLGDPPATFGVDPMEVSVSNDGVTFVSLGTFSEGLFPTQGYLDSDPFDAGPGSVLTDFTRPIDPALTLSDFSGLPYEQALALYDGSGGGTPIDIAAAGHTSISFLRIAGVAAGVSIEIDAFAAVPEPATAAMLPTFLLFGCAFRRKK